MFLSTKHCPGSDALRIEASGENFVIAHPLFWARAVRECRPLGPTTTNDLLGIARPFGGMDIVEMDGPFHDTEAGRAQREYRKEIWERVFDAISVASVELPPWLRAARDNGRRPKG